MRETTVLFDSLCPVCSREVSLLKALDRKGHLRTIDIAAPGFDPGAFGLTMDECVGSLRGIDADGRPIEGMDTIRAMYDAVGWGVLMRWTRWPGFRGVADMAYRVFARVRPRFSSFKPEACATDRCKL